MLTTDIKEKIQEMSVWYPDGDLVPESYQNELIMLREAVTVSYFRVGDIANNLVNRSATVGYKVTDQRIYEAVGNFFGKSGRTIRYYAEVSADFPEEIRQKYEILPFSYFVFARSVRDRAFEILDYALDNPAVPLDSLRSKFLERDKIQFIVGSPEDLSQDQESNVGSFPSTSSVLGNSAAPQLRENSQQITTNAVHEFLRYSDKLVQTLGSYRESIEDEEERDRCDGVILCVVGAREYVEKFMVK